MVESKSKWHSIFLIDYSIIMACIACTDTCITKLKIIHKAKKKKYRWYIGIITLNLNNFKWKFAKLKIEKFCYFPFQYGNKNH